MKNRLRRILTASLVVGWMTFVFDRRYLEGKLTDRMALSKLDEIKKLRRTLMKWRQEILNYFKTKLTNARTEGYNRVAKGEQYSAFGVRNFINYRLRMLNV